MTANTVFRDFVVDGNPASGAHKPVKSEIRALLTGYENGDLIIGDVASPVLLRTILTDFQEARMLRGTGDGSSVPADMVAETAKFQAICDTGRDFSIREPLVNYRVNQINMANGQRIEGCGQFGKTLDAEGGEYQFIGNGVNPIFRLGDGDGNPRQMALVRMSMKNDGATCIKGSTAPNILIEQCRARSIGAAVKTVDLELCYRAIIKENFIYSSGAGGAAIYLHDNINAAHIYDNTCGGGTLGYAIVLEQSQTANIIDNTIESSRYGVFVSSFAPAVEADAGNCGSVIVKGNYSEQNEIPFAFGLWSTVLGLDCTNNQIGNTNFDQIAARTAVFHLGRILGGRVCDNTPYMKTATQDEDLYWFYFKFGATAGFGTNQGSSGLVLRNNRPLVGKPLNIFRKFGQASAVAAYVENTSDAANEAVLASFGSTIVLDAAKARSQGAPIATPYINQSVSSEDFRQTDILWDTTASMTQTTWLRGDDMAFGGVVNGVEVLGWDGVTSLSGAQVAIGIVATPSEHAESTDLSAETWSNGSARIPLTSTYPKLRTTSNNTIRCIKGAAGNTRLIIRITWKAT